jgi:catechol 2,3-dioxygenase-like lactoylglutathione lyase family enzyme
MRFGHIELFVQNTGESRRFYEEILGFEVTVVQSEGKLVWLKLGDTEVLLRPGQAHAAQSRYRDASSGIVLYTDNLDQTLADLKRRGLELTGDDGPGCPTFTDPDGHWFQVVNPEGG